MSIKASVILPVYNVGKYLPECLDSIVSQTLRDIEVICVDDGSTDDSLAILQTYASKDDRIRLVRQANSGAGEARNNGLSKAGGEYVYFMDPDDGLASPTALAKLYATASSLKTDVLVFGLERIDGETGKFIAAQKFGSVVRDLPRVFSAQRCADRLFTAFLPAPWNKFFRREHVVRHQVRFQSLPRANDLCFSFTALATAERISVLDESLYRYRVNRKGSVQTGINSDPFPVCKAYLQVMENLKGLGLLQLFQANLTRSFFSSAFYTLYLLSDYSVSSRFFAEIRHGKYKELTTCRLSKTDFPGNETDYQRHLKFLAANDAGEFFKEESVIWRSKLTQLGNEPGQIPIENLRDEYNLLRNSLSCKLGLALTWPLRMAFSFISKRIRQAEQP